MLAVFSPLPDIGKHHIGIQYDLIQVQNKCSNVGDTSPPSITIYTEISICMFYVANILTYFILCGYYVIIF